MKIKNFVLAAGAFCFAVAGAIASSMTATEIFVHATKSQFGQIECVDTGKTCELPGTGVCSVRINTAVNGSTQTATSDASLGNFKTYVSGCASVLNSSDATLRTSTITGIYELQP